MTKPAPKSNGNASDSILVVDRVSKTFESNSQRSIPALAPVSMDIRKGDVVVFVGPSGCGKSTLLNLIAGFIQPSSGKITLEGEHVVAPGCERLMMFQDHGLFPWLNVIDNVSYGLKRRWFHPTARREKARQFLRMMHLENYEKANIHELSGGMKQRVALARALAPDPSVLLIDEPFSALDTVVRLELYAELQRIHQETKKTIIFVTHEMQEAACLGDRVMVFSGSPGSVIHELRIDLPRPRNYTDPQVQAHAQDLITRLQANPQ
ncbi:MAG: transporter related protein [Verrucomicrobiales bacterium]|nr:transporter related protein [Verrucomicrobiales bacterium]